VADPKKHHFLPQFYLEQFSAKDVDAKLTHIHVTTKEPHPKHYVAAIHDTGCISNYNTIDFRGVPPDRVAIEKQLSKAESDQKQLLDRILGVGQISPTDREELSRFVALMHMRVPKFKRVIESSLRSSVLSLGDAMLEHGKLPPLPESLSEYRGKRFRDFIDIDINNWIVLKYMYDTAIASEFGSILQRMEFYLLEAPNESRFITGDSPVVFFHPHYELIRPLGVSPFHKEVEITFPLSPTTMLLLINEVKEIGSVLRQGQVDEYNRRTVVMADRFVYSSESLASKDMLVSANAKRRAGFELSEVHTEGRQGWSLRLLPVRP
jgi:hypothetical protein